MFFYFNSLKTKAIYFILSFILLFLLPYLNVASCFAAELFQPAFKTIGVWNENHSIRVDVNVWYPTHSKPNRAKYGEWSFDVVRFGRPAKGRFPLIILSHDSASTRFSYHDTAALLARSGFVVMAPDHKNDNLQRMSQLFTWKQLEDRMRDVQIVINMSTTHKDVRNMIDANRIGLLGFGTGASVALLFGGARIDVNGFDGYCRKVPQSTAYCNAWAAKHVHKMLQGLPPLGRSFAENRIKAIVAVDPKYDMFFTKQSLLTLHEKVMLVEAGIDLKKKAWDTHNIRAFFPQNIQYNILEGIESRDLMAPCSQELKKDLPDLCGTATADVRASMYKIFSTEMLSFFMNILGKVS